MKDPEQMEITQEQADKAERAKFEAEQAAQETTTELEPVARNTAVQEAQPVKSQIKAGAAGLAPGSLDEMWRLACILAKSDCLPESFKGKAENALIAMHHGAALGMDGIVACQNIMIVNGRPCLWGDMPKALVMRSGLCLGFREWSEGSIKDKTYTAYCEAERKGYGKVVSSFSIEDAITARLWAKTGKGGFPTPWVTHPKRMLKARARAFTIRDLFPDLLMGLFMADEMDDIPEDEGIATEPTMEQITAELLEGGK